MYVKELCSFYYFLFFLSIVVLIIFDEILAGAYGERFLYSCPKVT